MKRIFFKKIFILGLLINFSHEVLSSDPVTDPFEQYFNEHKGSATVTVKYDPPKWIYTVTNITSKNSNLTINALNFDLCGEVEVINIPKDWTIETDNKSQIGWFAKKNRGIRPGESINFELKSSLKIIKEEFALISTWDNKLNKAGPVSSGKVKIPCNK